MFRWLTLLISFIILTTSLTAQNTNEPCKVCWHAQPKDSCDIIILTDFGIYLLLPSTYWTLPRLVADYGMLVNVGEHDAVGASFFVSFDNEIHFGPEIRYRRWLWSNKSIDFAFGLPIDKSYDGSWVASPYGMIKWNPVHWFGLALRTEFRRKPPPNGLGWDSNHEKSSHFYISFGVEFGGVPGVILTPVVPGILLIIIAATMGHYR